MRVVKIFIGILAALWGAGIFFKLLRNLPFIFQSPLGMSRLLGAIAGMVIAGVICYVCFRKPPRQVS